MARLTLTQASAIINASLAKGRALSLQPLTVVVLDAGGHAIALKREDGSGIARVEIATAKAWGGLGMGFGSRELFERASKLPHFVTAFTSVAGGRAMPVAGGVLVLAGDGEVIGAVGVSGDTSDNDEICAVAGIEAVGLRPKPGA